MGKPTMWFLNRSNTNQAVQAQKMAREILVLESRSTIQVAKTKALISFEVTAKLICVFVFAYADCLFSHEAAQMSITSNKIQKVHLVLHLKFLYYYRYYLIIDEIQIQ